MTLCRYFDKAPSALPNPNAPLSNHTPSEAISSANREVSGLVHQDTGQNRKTINTTRGPYATLYGGVTAMLHVPGPNPNSSYRFRENTFREIEFCH